MNEPAHLRYAAPAPTSPGEAITDPAPSVVVAPQGIIERIKQHKVVQWTLAYAALAYTLLHGSEMMVSSLGWPHGLIRFFTILLLLGAPIVATAAWYHGHRGRQKVTASEFMIIALLLAIGGAFLWRDTQTNSHGRIESVTAASAAAPAASPACQQAPNFDQRPAPNRVHENAA